MLANLKASWKDLTTGWIGLVTYSILGIVAALAIQFVGGAVLGTEFPVVTVSSNSMEPTMNVGDIVIVRSVDTYHAGDIIVFKGWRERPIIHRAMLIYDGERMDRYDGFNEFDAKVLIEAHQGGQIFVTKGDNNPICDQCGGHAIVTEGNVYGKSILRIPKIGLIKVCSTAALRSVRDGRGSFKGDCLDKI